jgi:hypothetical protein
MILFSNLQWEDRLNGPLDSGKHFRIENVPEVTKIGKEFP